MKYDWGVAPDINMVELAMIQHPEVHTVAMVHHETTTGLINPVKDIADVVDGYYRILGRASVDIIKSGGYKLSALEIESALLDHDEVAECAVVGLPDDTWGEAVNAAIVRTSGSTLTAEELRAWCVQRMSRYKVPKRMDFVASLPRNAMGKVTKQAVRQLLEDTDQEVT